MIYVDRDEFKKWMGMNQMSIFSFWAGPNAFNSFFFFLGFGGKLTRASPVPPSPPLYIDIFLSV
jgi:hypothetical protein